MNTTIDHQESNPSILQSRIDHHVHRLVHHYERFQELADDVADWADRWSTDALRRRLALAETREVRERALTALALQASTASGRVIDEYIPRFGGEHHELFHRVARIEWERRHDDDPLPVAS